MSGNQSLRIAGLLTLLLAGGCPFTSERSQSDGVLAEPDVGAISTVVKALYRMHGRGRIIFLGSDDGTVDSETLAQAGSAIAAELGVRVLPESAADRSDPTLPVRTPKDPETGELGISIEVDWFRVESEKRLAVSAWAVLSGLNAQEYDIVLERSGEDWVIVEMESGAVS